MSVHGYVCTAGRDRAPRERRSAARPLGVAFVVILRVAILALGLEFRGRRPLARRAAPRPRANVLARDLRPMIRPVLTEIALFLAPFLIYVVFLWATQAGVLHPNSWSLPRVAWLVIAALVLMIGSFVVLAQWGGSPPGSTYVPAHIEDGQFVPGETK
jgi:fatty acid desaturase